MNKFRKISLFALLFSSTFFVACDDDDATGYSTFVANSGVTGNVSLDFDANITVNEEDEGVYTYTVTLDHPQTTEVGIKIIQVSGSAIEGEDFEFDQRVIIPAYATSATGSITILNDDTVEGVEDVTLRIAGTSSANTASIPSQDVTFTINNYVSTAVDLTFNFDHNFSIAGTPYTLCGIGYDMDFYVFDAGFNDTGVYDAATGACPEHLSMDLADFADGEYYIYYDIYDDGGISGVYHDPFDIPVTVDYLRSGAITEGTFAQEAAFIPNSTDGSGFDYVITVEINAGIFTLKNSIPQVIATGKSNKIKSAIEAARSRRNK